MGDNHNEMPCRYFQKAGPVNTKAVMEAVAERAEEFGVKNNSCDQHGKHGV